MLATAIKCGNTVSNSVKLIEAEKLPPGNISNRKCLNMHACVYNVPINPLMKTYLIFRNISLKGTAAKVTW